MALFVRGPGRDALYAALFLVANVEGGSKLRRWQQALEVVAS